MDGVPSSSQSHAPMPHGMQCLCMHGGACELCAFVPVAPPACMAGLVTGVWPRLHRFFQAAAEQTGLPSASVDLVSCCLVMHELPQSASRAIIAEAHRILRPGGTIAIMVGTHHCAAASSPLSFMNWQCLHWTCLRR